MCYLLDSKFFLFFLICYKRASCLDPIRKSPSGAEKNLVVAVDRPIYIYVDDGEVLTSCLQSMLPSSLACHWHHNAPHTSVPDWCQMLNTSCHLISPQMPGSQPPLYQYTTPCSAWSSCISLVLICWAMFCYLYHACICNQVAVSSAVHKLGQADQVLLVPDRIWIPLDLDRFTESSVTDWMKGTVNVRIWYYTLRNLKWTRR